MACGQPTRCSAVGDAGLETVRAKPSNNNQRRALGRRKDAWREPRRAFKSVTGAVLVGSEPPNGRTSVRSAWTRPISMTPHRATRNSITRDPIMTGRGRGLDAAQSVGKTGGCAVLERVSGRELFRIGNFIGGQMAARNPLQVALCVTKVDLRSVEEKSRCWNGM